MRGGDPADPSVTRKLHRGLVRRRQLLVVAVGTHVPAEFGPRADAKLAIGAR